MENYFWQVVAIVVAFYVSVGVSPSALASTLPIFSVDGQRATVLLRGSPTDADAQRFFDLINMPAQNEQGKLTKKVKFTSTDGTDAVTIVCVFSQAIPGNGSCVITMKKAPGLTINGSARQASYELSGEEASRFAALFQSSSNPPAYRSADRHLELETLPSSTTHPELTTSFGYH